MGACSARVEEQSLSCRCHAGRLLGARRGAAFASLDVASGTPEFDAGPDASATSSSVARKEATSLVGRRWMKPTVSVRRHARPEGSCTW